MISRPTGGYATWASGASGNIVEPAQTDKNLGWQPTGIARSSYMNWLQNNAGQWHQFLDERRGIAHVGDGSDGNLILGATMYTMSRHMQFSDLAIGPSSILNTNGWISYVRGVLTGVSGIIRCNGATGGQGGVGPTMVGIAGRGTSGPLRGGFGGGTGVGQIFGESPINALGGTGGFGNSGASTGLARGGTCVSPSGIYSIPPANTRGYVDWLTSNGATFSYLRGGAGGGAGGADPTGGGGAGGEGGGVVVVVAREVNWSGTLEARGGGGGIGNALPGGGGGGGGGGGAVIVSYATKTLLSARVDVRGGPGAVDAVSAGGTGAFGMTTLLEYSLG